MIYIVCKDLMFTSRITPAVREAGGDVTVVFAGDDRASTGAAVAGGDRSDDNRQPRARCAQLSANAGSTAGDAGIWSARARGYTRIGRERS